MTVVSEDGVIRGEEVGGRNCHTLPFGHRSALTLWPAAPLPRVHP